jgi:hypothetical protein
MVIYKSYVVWSSNQTSQLSSNTVHHTKGMVNHKICRPNEDLETHFDMMNILKKYETVIHGL